MGREKTIKVMLPEGWGDYSRDNPDGPPTFLRDASEVSGALQVSFALHDEGNAPNPSKEDLIDLAKNTGATMPVGEVVETSSGECRFGIFGSAVFGPSEMAHTQIWYLSDGQDFVLATHICAERPDGGEIGEAEEIVMGLTIVQTREKWTKRFSGKVRRRLGL